MRLEKDARGDFVVEPGILARKLSIREDELRHRMRLGQVTSMVERGEGDDAGCERLSVRCGDMVWRAVVDAGLNVLSQEAFDLRYRRRSPE